MTTNAEPYLLTVPLTAENHECAKRFASEQSSREKLKQVYLNTLAVLAVDRFFQWMEFETDLNAADSWNPIIRRFNNVADLVLPELGKVECRPILPTEDRMILPPEVIGDRIAYLAVKFAEDLKQVEILGFLPTAESIEYSDIIYLADLQPLEELTDYLLNLDPISEEELEEDDDDDDETEENNLQIEVLRRWLEGTYGEGWQSPQEIFSSLRSRSNKLLNQINNQVSYSRAKFINLGDYIVVLLISVQLETENEIQIIFRLYPGDILPNLPEGIKLTLLDEDGDLFAEDDSEEPRIKWSEVEFDTQFSIQITLREHSFVESFQV